MKLTAGIRVKDGEPWAEECLGSLSRFVDDICILDDGSTDRTVAICRGFPKVRHLVRWPKSFFHEGIDRNVVLALMKDTQPDWLLFMDIDEVFQDRVAGEVEAMMACEDVDVWGFRMLHFWRDKRHFRMDGTWGNETQHHVHPRLVRNSPGLYFPPQMMHGAHILGPQGKMVLSSILIKHFGYAYHDRVIEKYEMYRRLDPDGDYKHLVDETGLQLMPYEGD